MRMRVPTSGALIVIAMALCAALFSAVPGGGLRDAPPAHAAGGISVNGGTRYQTIDGWGVNANPKNWGNPAYPPLQPALDREVDDLGATLWRVDVYGTSTWEATNDDADPFHFNWTYYDNLYASDPAFVSLWATLQELNAKGIQPILSASGLLPAWLGGNTIANEDEFVEMFTSLVYYARFTKGIQFTMVDPLNETDIGAPEGPGVSQSVFEDVLSRLRARFVALGMADLRFVAPETSSPNATYMAPILADPGVAPYMAAYAAHRYATTDVSAFVSQIKASAYPQPDFWMTEYSSSIDGPLDDGRTVPDEWAFADDMMHTLFSFVGTGASAALVWDAYDNVHDHSGSYTVWGLLDTAANYAPKKRYYATKQMFAYVRPGAVRIGASSSVGGVQVLAFADPGTGAPTIVGINDNPTAQTLSGTLAGVTMPASLALTQTNATLDNAPGGSVAVTGGSFSVTVAADAIFTLTSACTTCPTPTPTGAAGTATPTAAPGTPTPTPTQQGILNTPFTGHTLTFGRTDTSGANDNKDINNYNGALVQLSTSGTLVSLSLYAGATSPNAHVRMALYTVDASGNPAALVTQTGSVSAVAGWNTLPTLPVAIAPASYWIIAQTDDAATLYRIASGLAPPATAGWTTQGIAYGSFPSTLASAWTVVAGSSFSMYGTVHTQGSVGGSASIPNVAGVARTSGSSSRATWPWALAVAAALALIAGGGYGAVRVARRAGRLRG